MLSPGLWGGRVDIKLDPDTRSEDDRFLPGPQDHLLSLIHFDCQSIFPGSYLWFALTVAFPTLLVNPKMKVACYFRRRGRTLPCPSISALPVGTQSSHTLHSV